jgi:hypothetical protein
MKIDQAVIDFAEYFSGIFRMCGVGEYAGKEAGCDFDFHYIEPESGGFSLRVSTKKPIIELSKSWVISHEDIEKDFVYSHIIWGYLKVKYLKTDFDTDEEMMGHCKAHGKDLDEIYFGWEQLLSKNSYGQYRLLKMRQWLGANQKSSDDDMMSET